MQPLTSTATLLLNGNTIIKNKILDPKKISLREVLFIYIPRIWENDVEYESTLRDADIYYGTAPFLGKSNQEDLKRGYYKTVGHGYTARGGETSKKNVVQYDCKKLTLEVKCSLRATGNTIATKMWKALELFGAPLKKNSLIISTYGLYCNWIDIISNTRALVTFF